MGALVFPGKSVATQNKADRFLSGGKIGSFPARISSKLRDKQGMSQPESASGPAPTPQRNSLLGTAVGASSAGRKRRTTGNTGGSAQVLGRTR